VDQHRERPGDVELPAEVEFCKPLAVHELGLLADEPAVCQFTAALVEHLAAHLDARVVTWIEIVDERNATAQRAAAEVEQLVVRKQTSFPEEVDLESPFHLPEVGRPYERVPRSRRVEPAAIVAIHAASLLR
jgi:hypothetical protein